MNNEKNEQSTQVNSVDRKTETNVSPEKVDEASIQLSSEELNAIDGDAYKKLSDEYSGLKNNIVKSLLRKYHIRDSVKMSAINFDSLEDAETSLLKYCEKNNIAYFQPDRDVRVRGRDSYTPQPTKKYFLL